MLTKRQLILIILGGIINIILVLIISDNCLLKNLFNIDCAGCGTTRMLKAMLSLDMYQAFRYNPLMFILFGLLINYFIYCIICMLLRKTIYKPNRMFYVTLIIILFIYTIMRNMEFFSYLKPTLVN